METIGTFKRSSNDGPCSCPEPTHNLPDDILYAALSGNTDKVLSYYNDGGEINATAGKHGWTILGAACSRGHSQLVEKLLKLPELHMNVLSLLDMPLAWAIRGKYADCAEMMLKCTTLRCSLDVGRSWASLVSLMSRKPDVFYDIAIIVASHRDFQKLEELIKLKNRDFEVNVDLVKAAMELNQLMVKRLLRSESIDQQMDGSLIAISCVGTNDQIVWRLLPHLHDYSEECLETGLMLSSMTKNVAFLPRLLQEYIGKISYEALDKALTAATEKGHKNVIRVLETALRVKSEFCIAEANNETGNFMLKAGAFSCVLGETWAPDEVLRPARKQQVNVEVVTPATEESSDIGPLARTVPDLAKKALEATEILAEISKNLVIVSETAKQLLETNPAEAGTSKSSDKTIKLLAVTAEAQMKVTEALGTAAKALTKMIKEIARLAKKVTGKDMFSPIGRGSIKLY